MASVLKKRRKKMRKHKYKKLPEGKKVRIRVRTVNCVYVGDFLIPPMRNRVSDAINEEQRLFISLTDVVVNDKDRSDFVAVNKNLIESIAQI